MSSGKRPTIHPDKWMWFGRYKTRSREQIEKREAAYWDRVDRERAMCERREPGYYERIQKVRTIALRVAVVVLSVVLLLIAWSVDVVPRFPELFLKTSWQDGAVTGYRVHPSDLPDELVIPSSVFGVEIKRIESRAFYNCYELTSVTISDGVTSIGEGAFRACNNLTDVAISNSVTSIEKGAFAYCEKMEKVTIPSGVLTIEEEAFVGCRGLTTLVLDSYSIPEIARDAFKGCDNLKRVHVKTAKQGQWAQQLFSNASITIDG